MSSLTIRKTFRKDSVATDPHVVTLESSDGTYGVRRNDTGEAVVADGTAMTRVATGVYEHTFAEPASGLTYTWSLAVIAAAGEAPNYFTGTLTGATSESTPSGRRWESVICYEDRAALHTSRWRLAGVCTRADAPNTDAGVLWLQTRRVGDTVTAELYRSAARAAGTLVASGAVDVSGCAGTSATAVELTLSAANSSGLTGSLWIHAHNADIVCPVQVSLCVDEDLDALWDGVADLPGHDTTVGMAEFIRIAGEDVLAGVAKLFADALGGHVTAAAWYITDATRSVPDLRRIANPAQLRLACAYRALEIALGRSHHRAEDTVYSVLRDRFAAEHAHALASLTLGVTDGEGTTAANATATTRRLARG